MVAVVGSLERGGSALPNEADEVGIRCDPQEAR
jgi:hypothetical protein